MPLQHARPVVWFARALGLLLGVGVLAPVFALDPDKRFHHYVKDAWSIDQGLPQISAVAIEQDHEGYLWIGTQAGLARFDGVRFTVFNPENTPQLPGPWVQSLLSDRDGTLWIGTYKGLVRYAGRRFESVPQVGAEAGLDIRDLVQAADGRVLASTGHGLQEVRDGVLQRVPGLPDAPSFGLHADPDAVWIGAEGGALRLAADGVQRFALDPQDQPATVQRLVRAQGRLWAGTSRGLFFLDGERWQRHPDIDAGIGPVEAMHEDRDGNLWIAAHEALLRLRDARLVERIDSGSVAMHRAVRAIHEDREGNLWLGSQWEGIARLWNGWTRRHSLAEGLADPIVWSLARDPDGHLWVGGNDGLSAFEDGRFRRVLEASDLPHPNAYTLLAERDQLWIGTRRGLARLRDGDVDIPPVFAALANLQVNGLHRDRAGTLWIASSDGLFRERDGDVFRYGAAQGLEDARVRLLRELGDGRMLFGTQNGLFEVQGERVARAGIDAGLPPAIDVTALHELPDGELVLGTLSEQLFHFDGERWFPFGRESGLPVNSPFFLTHDRAGWVWVAGIRGVYRVRLDALHAFRRGESEQVAAEMLLSERGDQRGSQKGYCCNGAGNAKGFIEDDTLWLPTRDGVVTLTSAAIDANPVLPPVSIERVRVNGHWRTVLPDQPLALQAGDRDLAFEFSALSFQQPTSVAIHYRLQGYDETWQTLADTTRRDAVYTNLPPGEYRFEVQGANNALRWNPEPAVLAFEIPPRWHESTLFHFLVAAGLVGLGLAVQRLRDHRLHRRQQVLEKLVAQRTDDLAAANLRLQEMSHTDALTGLRNRRFLHSQLPADLSFYLREVRKPGNEGMVMMLALVDIDHFKAINDRHGHAGGDRVLEQFARVMERQVRSGDYVVRWGGEEFLLVFRPMPRQEAVKIAERVRSAIAAHPFDAGADTPIEVTASIGFIEYPLFRESSGVPDWERMVEVADLALYAVKSSGRDGWATFRPTQPMPLESLLDALRPGVDAALAGGEVSLVRSPPRA
jgi:diguanylate cyclase (GGDEF)-like protein